MQALQATGPRLKTAVTLRCPLEFSVQFCIVSCWTRSGGTGLCLYVPGWHLTAHFQPPASLLLFSGRKSVPEIGESHSEKKIVKRLGTLPGAQAAFVVANSRTSERYHFLCRCWDCSVQLLSTTRCR